MGPAGPGWLPLGSVRGGLWSRVVMAVRGGRWLAAGHGAASQAAALIRTEGAGGRGAGGLGEGDRLAASIRGGLWSRVVMAVRVGASWPLGMVPPLRRPYLGAQGACSASPAVASPPAGALSSIADGAACAVSVLVCGLAENQGARQAPPEAWC